MRARTACIFACSALLVGFDPAWSTLPPMSSARVEHTATLLGDGTVLVVGGTYLSTAEIFDPKTKTWSSAPAMSAKRSGHTATRLSSGKVLVVGGASDSSTALSTAQLYDEATKTWSDAAPMTEKRYHHRATLLAGDKVLVTGGSDYEPGGESSTAVIWDAATNTWSAAGTMSVGRQMHAATLLASGQVLVTGGRRGGGVMHSSADLFDPATKTWTALPSMSTVRAGHAAVVLSSGLVLVTGGYGFDKYASLQNWDSAELFDPATKTWSATASPMSNGRSNHTIHALPGDRALVIGGTSNLGSMATVDLFTLADKRFAAFAALATKRAQHAAVQLANGDVLATGGSDASAELLTLGHPGDACTKGPTECASGFCVDGVCCNAACTGQCEACDAAGLLGTCSPVIGAPHGARTACGGTGCAATKCDGAERSKCAAFADVTTTCAPASCTDGASKPEAKCDGKGACSTTATTTACAPYACGTNACKTTCQNDMDCSGSNVCDTKTQTCVVADATCTGDGLASQPLDRSQPAKDCAPYRCDGKSGHCFDRCDASDVCGPSAVCDGASHTCVGGPGEGDSGGCAVGARSGGGALAALAILGLLSRRRRR